MDPLDRISGKMNGKRGDLFLQAELRLKGYVATIAPAARFVAELPEGSRVRNLLEAYFDLYGSNIRDDFFNSLRSGTAENVFIFVNDGQKRKQVLMDSVLHDGSIVTVVSPLAGG